ncbi:MAG TPA: DUF6101 family protein [Beijerinckiaceae bacterium]|jgi:hypothetical protein
MEAVQNEYQTPRSSVGLRDRRADGGERDVHLAKDRVTIRRRLAGIRMQVAVPMRSYRGVVLSLFRTGRGEACYRVTLRHQDPDLSIVLTEAFDEATVTEEWRAWAHALAQAALVESDGGELVESTRTAPAPHRRGGRPTKGRRGRFAARRRVGAFASGPVVHAGEREIVCYE